MKKFPKGTWIHDGESIIKLVNSDESEWYDNWQELKTVPDLTPKKTLALEEAEPVVGMVLKKPGLEARVIRCVGKGWVCASTVEDAHPRLILNPEYDEWEVVSIPEPQQNEQPARLTVEESLDFGKYTGRIGVWKTRAGSLVHSKLETFWFADCKRLFVSLNRVRYSTSGFFNGNNTESEKDLVEFLGWVE